MYNYFMDETITYTHLVKAIRDAGLAQGILCLHSSLKSFGYVEGGADTVLRAFLDEGCTLIVPTFTYESVAPPPPDRRILQNGMDNTEGFDASKQVGVYDQNSTMIVRDMGAIPARLLAQTGRARSVHPLNSFGGLGPQAQALIDTQTLLNVYGPYKAMYANPSAHLALIGVDLTKATPIHFAEELAGRRLFRRWARSMGVPSVQETAVGGCSDGFNNFAPLVRSIETNVTVGKSLWRVYPFTAFIDTVKAAIVQNPQITHCENANCSRCNDAVRGGAIL